MGGAQPPVERDRFFLRGVGARAGGGAPGGGACCGRARAALAGARADCLVLNHRLEEAAGVIERQAGRIAALEAIPGWIWSTQEANFEEGLAALTQFVDREGHCRNQGNLKR